MGKKDILEAIHSYDGSYKIPIIGELHRDTVYFMKDIITYECEYLEQNNESNDIDLYCVIKFEDSEIPCYLSLSRYSNDEVRIEDKVIVVSISSRSFNESIEDANYVKTKTLMLTVIVNAVNKYVKSIRKNNTKSARQ